MKTSSDRVKEQLSRPLRVGLWGDVLVLSPEVRALLESLSHGLTTIDEATELVLLVPPGDERRWEAMPSLHGLRLVQRGTPATWVVWARRCSRQWTRGKDAILRRWRPFAQSLTWNKGRFSRIRGRRKPKATANQAVLTLAALLLWIPWAVCRLAGALTWGLLAPFWLTDRLVRRVQRRLQRIEVEAARQAECDIWLVPGRCLTRPVEFPTAELIHDAWQLPSGLPLPNEMTSGGRTWNEFYPTAWLTRSAELRKELIRSQHVPRERVRIVPSPSASANAAERWYELLHDCHCLGSALKVLDKDRFVNWPTFVEAPRSNRRPEVFVFLQFLYSGGNWEHTKNLVAALIAVNRKRRQLRLTFGAHEDQPGVWELARLARADFVPFGVNPIERSEVARLAGREPAWMSDRHESRFLFLSGAAEAALRADAWLALADRFALPLLPARPYAVVVHDMLPWRVPETVGNEFLRNLLPGMIATMKHAHRVVVTSPVTREDVIAEYGLAGENVEMIPVACEPHRRFGAIPGGFVPLPRTPFLLNVTNASPHKGAQLLLQAYALLKRQLGPATPLLVLCGVNTEKFAPSYAGQLHPYWAHVRSLVVELGLVERQDVVFLGTVTDPELKDLYERCSLVINSARYDNGTYSLIEAKYFGRPVVSTRYPAAEFLCDRFGVSARFCTLDHVEDLAAACLEQLQQPRLEGPMLQRARQDLAATELSIEQYAGRLYSLLVNMATQSRAKTTARQGDREKSSEDAVSLCEGLSSGRSMG